MNQARAVLKMASSAVRQGDKEEVLRFLRKLPLEKLPLERSFQIFELLVSQASDFDSEATEAILNAFNEKMPSSEDISFQAQYMCSEPESRGEAEKISSFLLRKVPEHFNFAFLVTEMIQTLPDFRALRGVRLCNSLIPPTYAQDLETARQFAEDSGLAETEDFLRKRYGDRGRAAPRPPWMLKVKGARKPPREDVFDIPELYPETHLAEEPAARPAIEEYNRILKKFRESSIYQLPGTAPPPTKREERVLSMLLGPENRFVQFESYSSSLGVSYNYNGPRMLLCDIFDYDPDLEEDYTFQGACQECGGKVKSIWRTARVPVVGGGWKRYMCSWKCVRDFIRGNGNEPVAMNLARYFETQMTPVKGKRTMGVIDREPALDRTAATFPQLFAESAFPEAPPGTAL